MSFKKNRKITNRKKKFKKIKNQENLFFKLKKMKKCQRKEKRDLQGHSPRRLKKICFLKKCYKKSWSNWDHKNQILSIRVKKKKKKNLWSLTPSFKRLTCFMLCMTSLTSQWFFWRVYRLETSSRCHKLTRSEMSSWDLSDSSSKTYPSDCFFMRWSSRCSSMFWYLYDILADDIEKRMGSMLFNFLSSRNNIACEHVVDLIDTSRVSMTDKLQRQSLRYHFSPHAGINVCGSWFTLSDKRFQSNISTVIWTTSLLMWGRKERDTYGKLMWNLSLYMYINRSWYTGVWNLLRLNRSKWNDDVLRIVAKVTVSNLQYDVVRDTSTLRWTDTNNGRDDPYLLTSRSVSLQFIVPAILDIRRVWLRKIISSDPWDQRFRAYI